MATYVNDLRLKEIATGDEAGTWGTSTNTNLELIGEALGYGTQDCFSSDADATTTVADGTTDPARAMYFKVTSSATLTATRTLTIAPNTISRVMFIENATTGSQSITISQGTGANVTIATGKTAVVYLDGAGSGAAVVDAMALVDPGITDTLAEVLVAGNTTGGTSLVVSSGDDVTFTGASANIVFDSSDSALEFADNAKAIFGAGSDLQIYHDGTNSYISDQGTNDLKVLATDFQLKNAADNEFMMTAVTDGAVTAYHNGSAKLATTSTGIDVTGTITADDITLSDADAPTITMTDTTNNVSTVIKSGNSTGFVGTTSNHTFEIRHNNTAIVDVTSTGIDVTGTAVIETGSGNTYPTASTSADNLVISDKTASTPVGITIFSDNASQGNIFFGDENDADNGRIVYDHNGNANTMSFFANGAERMRIDGSGNVGIGRTTDTVYSGSLQIAFGNGSQLATGTSGNPYLTLTDNSYLNASGNHIYKTSNPSTRLEQSNGTLTFSNAASGTAGNTITYAERMRIDASGNVGIGTSSPNIANFTKALTILDSSASNQIPAIELAFGSNTRGANIAVDNRASVKALAITAVASDLAMTFGTNNTERMRIDSSGNVAIGQQSTTGGSVKLDLHNSGNGVGTQIAFYNDHNTGGHFIGQAGNTTGNIIYYNVANTNQEFYNNNSLKMTLDSSGNALVGRSSRLTNQTQSISANTVMSVHGVLTSHQSACGVMQYVGDAFQLRAYGASTGTGNIQFLVGGGGGSADSEAMRIDSSGNVGIGMVPPSDRNLAVYDASNSIFSLHNSTTGTSSGDGFQLQLVSDDAYLVNYEAGGIISFYTAPSGGTATERMRIDASGQVKVGTTGPTWDSTFGSFVTKGGFLSSQSTSYNYVGGQAYYDGAFKRLNANAAELYEQSFGNHIFYNAISGAAGSTITWNERMRIDASGNVLVGTTTINGVGGSSTPEGVVLDGNNAQITVGTSSDVCATFNRQTTDGAVVQFRKNGSTVGSIGTYVNLPYIGKSDVNLLFDPAGPHVIPRGTNGGARDGAINLGESSNRFKDLYLSGKIYASKIISTAGRNSLGLQAESGGIGRVEANGAITFVDDATLVLTDAECGAVIIHVYDNDVGEGAIFFATYTGGTELLAGVINSSFSTSDTDGKLCVFKSGNSHTVTFKNRKGSSRNMSFMIVGAQAAKN